MRTETIKIYSFYELSEEAKEKAIENGYDINVNHDWWDCTYETMKEAGIKVNSFDIYHRNINITIEDSEFSANEIIENFGEAMEIVLISKQFIKDRYTLVKQYGEGNEIAGYSVKEENLNEFDEEIEYLEEEYRMEIANEILSWLTKEYEYLVSDEAIIETFEANEYEFTEDGIIY